MTNDNRLNIIHISDTHIQAKNKDELRKLRQALIGDIKRNITENELKSTIVCFTGDIIFRGDYGYAVENQFDLAREEFILPLLFELNIDSSSLFIVPGNHEIDLSKINPIYQRGLGEILRKYDGKLDINYSNELQLKERLDGYRTFEKDLCGCYSDDIISIRKAKKNSQTLGVCLINSSWNLSSNSENEKGNVIIGSNVLSTQLQKIKNCDYKICLLHHSLGWLRDEETVKIESLMSAFDLVLYGHSHKSEEKQVVSPNGKTVFCMAGELLPISSNSNYNLIKIDSNICTVLSRQYYESRNAFDENLEYENGKYSFTLKEEDVQSLVFNAYIKTKSGFDKHIDSISITSLINEGAKSFDSYYVIPKLSCVIDNTIEGNKSKKSMITPDELISSDDNYVIYGKKEYGKTLLLNYIAKQYYHGQQSKKIPFIIDCNNIKSDIKSIFSAIRSYIADIGDDDFKISVEDVKKILSSGDAILLFDNYSSDDNNVNIIANFVKEYAKNKRFFAVTQTASIILENKIADELFDEKISKYNRIYMHYMTKNDIRQMARSLSICEPEELSSFTTRIVSCFNKTYLPRTPFAVSLVVSVCNINGDYEPVNLAAVVKRFLEIVMDRLSPKELLSNEFNFDDREDFLAFIAYRMVKDNRFEVSSETFLRWVMEYHEDNGFELDKSHFNEYFFACGILEKNNGKISFKYRCLLEYFIGKQASIDYKFLEYIISKEHCINYFNELIYCSGIDKRNSKVVDILGEYVNEQMKDKKIDTSFLSGDKIKLDLSIGDDEIKVQLTEKQLEETDIDKETDCEDNSESYLPNTINKERDYDKTKFELDYYDELLSAFGNAIRNTDLTKYKPRYNAFQNYMKGLMYWCMILANSVEEFIKIVRRDIFEKETTKDNFDIDKAEEVFRDFCRIAIPTFAENNLFECLGTKKLSKIFVDFYNSSLDYNSLDKFISLLVILDLKLTKWKELLNDFLKNSNSKDLKIVLLYKLLILYRVCHFGKANNKYLAEILFELNKSLNKSFSSSYGMNKTKFINEINRQQLPEKSND